MICRKFRGALDCEMTERNNQSNVIQMHERASNAVNGLFSYVKIHLLTLSPPSLQTWFKGSRGTNQPKLHCNDYTTKLVLTTPSPQKVHFTLALQPS